MDMIACLVGIALLGLLTYWWESSFDRRMRKRKQELEKLKNYPEWQEWLQVWEDWEKGYRQEDKHERTS